MSAYLAILTYIKKLSSPSKSMAVRNCGATNLNSQHSPPHPTEIKAPNLRIIVIATYAALPPAAFPPTLQLPSSDP